MTVLEAPKGARADWLEWRRGHIGASDIAGILGISKWASPWSVWADKTGLLPSTDDLDDDDPREFGKRAEAMLGPWFTDKTGLHIVGEQMWCTHPEHRWMGATPDGAVSESPHVSIEDVTDGLEIKTEWGSTPWPDGQIPAQHQAQAQWQMAVTGWERVWFAVLHGRRFRTYTLERDQDDIDFMVERAERFWREHVETGEPPPVDGSDATLDALAAVYPGHVAGETADLTAARYALEELEAAKAAVKVEKDREARARAVLEATLGTAEVGVIDGEPVVTWRSQTRRSLDSKALTAAHPQLAAEFERETSYRVLRIVKPKGDK